MSLTNIDNKFYEIIVGTNEELLLGYNITPGEDGKLSLQSSFSNHSHTGRIKTVAVSVPFLVSGSSDEHIRIYNLNTRKEVGYMLHHEGSVSYLMFHKSGFLFSCAEDGNIAIYKKGKWEVEKMLTGHNSPVNSIAVHPSGKLALSVSKDRRMIIWDLIKGKRAYASGLPKAGESIHWTPSGSHYLISAGSDLCIYSLDTGTTVHSVDFLENINSVLFINDTLIAVGGEGRNICLYDIEKKREILQWEAHDNRIKSLVAVDYSDDTVKIIASASSDGHIKIWSVNISSSASPSLLGDVDTKCRIICMTIRTLKSGLFELVDDDAFVKEFQQKQDDYHSGQKERKMRRKRKSSCKERVVVIEENATTSPAEGKQSLLRQNGSLKPKKHFKANPQTRRKVFRNDRRLSQGNDSLNVQKRKLSNVEGNTNKKKKLILQTKKQESSFTKKKKKLLGKSTKFLSSEIGSKQQLITLNGKDRLQSEIDHPSRKKNKATSGRKTNTSSDSNQYSNQKCTEKPSFKSRSMTDSNRGNKKIKNTKTKLNLKPDNNIQNIPRKKNCTKLCRKPRSKNNSERPVKKKSQIISDKIK